MTTPNEVTGGLRILYVITKANWGGAQRYVFDMACAAKAKGHTVKVVSGTEGLLLTKLKEQGIETHTIAALKRDIALTAEYAAFQELCTLTRTFKPDVMHGNSSKGGTLAMLAGILAHVPHRIFTAHGWAFNENRPWWQRTIIGLVHYVTVLLSHTTICVSHAIRTDAHWMVGVQHKLRVIHNGVQPIDLLSQDAARTHLAPEFKRTFSHALWIGTIAELHPTKGIDVLIEAFATHAQEHPSSLLVVMGEGDDRGRLEKLLKIHNIGDRVILAGFVADAARYLHALDIFVLPSRTEALGYVLLEAGLAHLPAIGTRVGGIPEVLTDLETGLLVSRDAPKELAHALTTLTTDGALRTRLGDALFNRVQSDFSINKMVAETLAVYRR